MFVCLSELHEKPWLDHERKDCNGVVAKGVAVKIWENVILAQQNCHVCFQRSLNYYFLYIKRMKSEFINVKPPYVT